MSLTNTQLIDLAKRMDIPMGNVSFKDEIGKIQYNKGYIINSQDALDEDGKDNDGAHWVCLYIREYPNGKKEGIYFDPYGVGKAQIVKKTLEKQLGKDIPETSKNIQSLMANCCGYYCLAFLHFITASQFRSKDLYQDVSTFLDLFDDLDKSTDFKKNEYILKHFFRSKDPSKRVPVEIDLDTSITDRIVNGDGGRVDLTKIPIGVEMAKK